MKYPYIQHAGKFLPIVPVELEGKDEWLEFNAYIDSGAGYTIFHAWVAEALGIELEKGKRDYVIVGDGSQIKVFIHRIGIRLAGLEFRVIIGFSERLGIGFNIIGQQDVFDRFKICFDRSERIVEFHPKSKQE